MNFYQHLFDHYKHSKHRGHLAHPSFTTTSTNPSCGDSITIEGVVINDIVTELKFTGSGCVISQATASLLIDQILGKPTSSIKTIDHAFILKLIGLSLGPNRLRCALLSYEALAQGILSCSIVQK